MTDFTTLIADARQFYGALAANNTRDWWLGNKGPYDQILKPAAHEILESVAPHIAALSDTDVTTKLFRPHRDVRFSKDKTPYQTHLHMMWQLETDAAQSPVYFFGIGQDYVTAGAGMMGFDKKVLMDWRKFVDLDTDRVQGIIDHQIKDGAQIREPALKRVPPPFDKDHPAAELLRMKGLVISKELGAPTDLIPAIQDAFTSLWPVNELLVQIAES